MNRIEWSTDTDLVEATMKNPDVYPWVSDDNCPSAKDFRMVDVDGERTKAALCYHFDKYVGCFILFDKGDSVLEIHTCLLPVARGMGKVFGRMVVEKIFLETDCKEISTYIPETNPLAKKLALYCGFELVGDGDPMIINGEPVKVYYYSRYKPCQQSQR